MVEGWLFYRFKPINFAVENKKLQIDMYIENEHLAALAKEIMGRFDRLDKFMEIMSGRHNVLNGERLLDNQDLCQMLNVSKRTLQRYRSAGELTYITIHHKIFYTEKNVEKFIRDHFAEGEYRGKVESEQEE